MNDLDRAESPTSIPESLSERRERANRTKESALILLGRATYECVHAESNPRWLPEATSAIAIAAAEYMLRTQLIIERYLVAPAIVSNSTHAVGNVRRELLWEEIKSASYRQTLSLLNEQSLNFTTHRLDLLKGLDFRESVILGAVRSDFLSGQILVFLVTVLEPLAQQILGTSGLVYSERWDERIIDDGLLEIGIFTAGIDIDAQLRAALGASSEEAARKWKMLYENIRD